VHACALCAAPTSFASRQPTSVACLPRPFLQVHVYAEGAMSRVLRAVAEFGAPDVCRVRFCSSSLHLGGRTLHALGTGKSLRVDTVVMLAAGSGVTPMVQVPCSALVVLLLAVACCFCIFPHASV
jgi:hypothetical protein